MGARFDLFDLLDMQLFAHVVEARSLTRGAERAGLSPAAASARIRQMEDAVGTKLLHRTAQGVSPTPAGDTLLFHATRVMQQLAHLRVDLLGHVEGDHGHVRMLANTTSITEHLPDALARFLSAHPGVGIDLREGLSSDIVRAVADGSTDLGIVAGTMHTDGLHTRAFGHNQLVLCVPAAHPLGERAGVTFSDTLAERYVSLHAGSALREFLARIADQMGRPLRLRIQVGSFEAICRMVEAGVGVGIVPETSARRHARAMDIRIVPLTDPWARRDLQLVARDAQALPAVARRLLEYLEAFARDKEAATPAGRAPAVRAGHGAAEAGAAAAALSAAIAQAPSRVGAAAAAVAPTPRRRAAR